jgi:regulatory protein
MTPSDLEKLRAWCALRERSTFDVRAKLQRMGIAAAEADGALATLTSEGYLNEARFVEAYVEGHARGKRWGPARIRAGLRARRIPESLIAPALAALDPATGREALGALVARRASELPAGRNRVIRWLVGRGYPLDEVLAAVDAAASR